MVPERLRLVVVSVAAVLGILVLFVGLPAAGFWAHENRGAPPDGVSQSEPPSR